MKKITAQREAPTEHSQSRVRGWKHSWLANKTAVPLGTVRNKATLYLTVNVRERKASQLGFLSLAEFVGFRIIDGHLLFDELDVVTLLRATKTSFTPIVQDLLQSPDTHFLEVGLLQVFFLFWKRDCRDKN